MTIDKTSLYFAAASLNNGATIIGFEKHPFTRAGYDACSASLWEPGCTANLRDVAVATCDADAMPTSSACSEDWAHMEARIIQQFAAHTERLAAREPAHTAAGDARHD